MNRKTIVGLVLGATVVLGLGILSSVTQAHSGRPTMTNEQRQQMMGSGMMSGRGLMGMAPGMMGSGMGPGMMDHTGMMGGPGMMGMPPMGMLNLTAEQRAQIRKLQDEHRRQNWSTMGKIMDESSKLRQLYDAGKWDPKAIGAAYGKIFDLQRQMIEASIAAHNRQETVLTQEQRDQLTQWRWGRFMGGGPGMHSGGMMMQ